MFRKIRTVFDCRVLPHRVPLRADVVRDLVRPKMDFFPSVSTIILSCSAGGLSSEQCCATRGASTVSTEDTVS